VADFVVEVGVVVVVVVLVALVFVFVVLADGEDVVPAVLVAVEDEEAVCETAVPAFSFATRRPTRAVDAVAATTADCVIRRRRRRAR
jgi:hypothetical protein